MKCYKRGRGGKNTGCLLYVIMDDPLDDECKMLYKINKFTTKITSFCWTVSRRPVCYHHQFLHGT